VLRLVAAFGLNNESYSTSKSGDKAPHSKKYSNGQTMKFSEERGESTYYPVMSWPIAGYDTISILHLLDVVT